MKLVKVENTCEIHMRRHGKTTLTNQHQEVLSSEWMQIL